MAKKTEAYPTVPSLVGEHVYLRPASPEDIANTHHWSLQSDVNALGCWPRRLDTAIEAAERFRTDRQPPDRQDLILVRKKDNTPVGRIAYFNLNSRNRSAELGLIIDPDEQKQGFGTEAMQILCRYLFSYQGLNKVYAQSAAFSTGAIKLLEKLGFRRDGTLRAHYYYGDEFHDGVLYSLLRFELDF